MQLALSPLLPPPSPSVSASSLQSRCVSYVSPMAITPSTNLNVRSPTRTAPALESVKVSAHETDVKDTNKSMNRETEEIQERFPTATLDAESISDVMAARLATCLLGHVLYLKSQVPFPVAQLMRMSSVRKTDLKAAKKEETLLATFDLLSSHLGSTFTALSAAFAAPPCGSHLSKAPYTRECTNTQGGTETKTATTHFAIVLGPSVTSASAARARVVLELDGLRVQQWTSTSNENPRTKKTGIVGRRTSLNGHLKENNCNYLNASTKMEDNTGDEESDSQRFEASPVPKIHGNVLGYVTRIGDDSGDLKHEDEHEEASDDDESVPDSESESDSDSDADEGSSLEYESDIADNDDFDAPASREESEKDLLAAERLLSRTLAVANADPEQGMAAEIRPTQTHLLLRAPRRFAHPAWIPRPNLARDMDPVLLEFVRVNQSGPSSTNTDNNLTNATNDSGPARGANSTYAKAANGRSTKNRRNGLRTDCVRVQCRAASRSSVSDSECKGGADTKNAGMDSGVDDGGSDEERNEEDEASEMIWWSWDGRLEGFSAW
ncbi:hypothetical protein M0805_006436 [Coniferiporia weirii]|nr:hypothetical protein M0805_006436 [Coniferiporia weirii]